MIVSAHAGYPRLVNSGADYIEVDVRRNADGMFVISHDEPKPGGKLPMLDEVLDAAAGKVGVQLDLKEAGHEVEVVSQAIEKCQRLAVTSPFYESIRTVKDRFPEVKVGLTRQYVEQTDADFISLDQRGATDEALDFCASHSIPVWVWTVDDRKLMERLIPRAAGIITNRPEIALKLTRGRA